ncbi:exonuclease [archaeon]|nr:exonuclease [archaeon]
MNITKEQLKHFTWIPLPKFEQAVPQHTKYNHFYKAPDGQVFKSVTTMLYKTSPKSDGIKYWRAKVGSSVADFITEEAKKNGTGTHNIIEKYLNNEPIPELSLLIRGHFSQLKPLLDKIDHISATEIPLYSYEMRLAGMADCIGKYDGIDTLIDFKTSRTRKKEEWIENYFLQATIYAKMWNSLTGNFVNQMAILISCEDGTVQEFIRKPSDYWTLLDERLKKFEEIGGFA